MTKAEQRVIRAAMRWFEPYKDDDGTEQWHASRYWSEEKKELHNACAALSRSRRKGRK